MIAKTVYIRDISPGKSIQDVFLLADARPGQSRAGDPYWSLLLQDKTGQMEARVWSPLAQKHPGLAAGQIVRLRGQAATYRDKCQVTIDQLEPIDPAEAELAEFLPPSPVDAEALLGQLEELFRRELTYKPWRNLMKRLFSDETVRAKLLPATGAKAIHHAYSGGLLEHTLAVARTCLALSDLYPQLDREILLVAASVHDLGKAWELDSGLSRDYTDAGRLLGHIELGLEKLEPFLAKTKDLDPALAMHLKHIILSHHGEYEFGSPKLPQTPEALILHFADNIDAKMNTMAGAYAEIADTELSWTPYQRSLERFLYRAPHTPVPEGRKSSEKSAPQDEPHAGEHGGREPIDKRFLLLPLG